MDPDRDVDPGLVYDVEAREYNRFFNCTTGLLADCESYDLNLNLPSIVVPNVMDTYCDQHRLGGSDLPSGC